MFADYFDNKKILITGVCGTVGKEILNQLILNTKDDSLFVIGLDKDESGLFLLEQEYSSKNNITFILGDICSEIDLVQTSKDIDIIFHCAAYKHVVLTEKSPFQAVKTNIIGVQNLINAANLNQVQKVIFTSSDKAVNPTNVMGTSKLMGERLITAANCFDGSTNTVFASTRFGNVLGSNGSVVPVFKKQILSGGPVTLTDVKMTRFVMSVKQAAELVMQSCIEAKGGEVFVTKMPVMRIEDLANVMIDLLIPEDNEYHGRIKSKIIGSKPGEKLYEELMSGEEAFRTIELSNYYCILPAFRDIYSKISYKYENVISDNVGMPYNSENSKVMNTEEIKKFISINAII